ncbi:TetR family transcriptional regulator [Actinophytocola sp.]|uniref:TetR/AcrR family transcriptional regulator n=1 Tax=Actinophytocola sp. TaxID=1872138 RepID=UPI0025BDA994|nr:TetR family transcriptional regulator [Actinophytocola sp.]
MTRRGRRPANSQTRAAVMGAARETFAARGYLGATIRQIAATAGVDPSLVLYFFGSKDQLFRTVLTSSVDGRQLLSQLFDGPADELGQRLVTRFLRLWEGDAGATASALLRTAVTEQRFGTLVREHIAPAVTTTLVERVGVDPAQASVRAALLASQLSGLVLARYLLRIEPIASATIDWVAAAIGPTIQRYLTGALPTPPATAPPVLNTG